MAVTNHDTQAIARANDEFRRECFAPLLTNGVLALDDVVGLITAVQQYDNFTADNDPWGEHDFGSLQWQGVRVFWKIDYYDLLLHYGVSPLRPDCRRVLTIMTAEEY